MDNYSGSNLSYDISNERTLIKYHLHKHLDKVKDKVNQVTDDI